MESETEAASGKSHRDSTITAANYTFTLLGEQDLGANHCFVVQATPTRSDKYLFEGKVWIDAQDYAVVQIVGHPAKSSRCGSTKPTSRGAIKKLAIFGCH